MKYRIVSKYHGKHREWFAQRRVFFFFWRSIEHDFYDAWDWEEPKKYSNKEDAQAAIERHVGREVGPLRSKHGINEYICYMG